MAVNYRLSIIIPVYNEEKTVCTILDRLLAIDELNNDDVQYLVIDDGSSDSTTKKLKDSKYSDDTRFTFLFHEQNMGKGSAIRAGLQKAQGRYTIIQDADLEYDPQDIVKLLSYAESEKKQVVFGSRNKDKKNQKGRPMFYWGGRLVTWFANILFGQKLTDEPTCYKLFETVLLKSFPLTCKRFEFCPEVTAYTALKGIKIDELPISYHPRNKEEGKKINWKDGVEALCTLARIKFLRCCPELIISLSIGLFLFCIYMMTWSGSFVGYEYETADGAKKLLAGVYDIRRAGVGAVLMYVPFLYIFPLVSKLFIIDTFLTLVPIFYSALTFVFLYYIFREFDVSKRRATCITLIIGVGSIVWPYTRIGMEYQSMLILTILLFSLLCWRHDTNKSLLPTGLVFLWLVLAKSYAPLIGLAIVAFIIVTLFYQNNLKKIWHMRIWLESILPAILGFVFLIVLNYIIYDRFSGAYHIAHEFQIWYFWEGFFGIFFSFGKSILLYSPLLIVTLFYWKKFFKEQTATAWFVMISFLVILGITAPFSYWSDETLSIRKLIPMIVLLHLPLYLCCRNNIISNLKKIVIILVLISSIYIQFVNSLYHYKIPLDIVRTQEMDRLSELRYIPQFSHLHVNNNLFVTYITGTLRTKESSFQYSERSWMRYVLGNPDVVQVDINYDIEHIARPDLFLFHISHIPAIVYLCLVFGGLVFSGMVLYFLTKEKNYE